MGVVKCLLNNQIMYNHKLLKRFLIFFNVLRHFWFVVKIINSLIYLKSLFLLTKDKYTFYVDFLFYFMWMEVVFSYNYLKHLSYF